MFLNLRKLAAKDTEFASELVTRELEILNALQRTTEGSTTGNDTITTRSTRTQLPIHPRQEFELRNRPQSRLVAQMEEEEEEEGFGSQVDLVEGRGRGRRDVEDLGDVESSGSGIQLAGVAKRGGRWVSPPMTPTIESR
jgi:hypothetical protein